MLMNIENRKFGFSLAEALITLLIVAIITLATIPVITKKHRNKTKEKHGAFACYWVGNQLVGKYLIDGEKTNATTTYDATEGRSGCVFNPPVGAKNFVVTLVGGGGGGAKGFYEEREHLAIGESGGSFQVPVDGAYRLLLMGAGGAGGHTSSGQVCNKYGSSQAPAVSGSPAGLIVSNNILLKEKAAINYSLGVQGWAREDNDGYPQGGNDATANYSASNGDSFSIAAQGGGGGASMNYDGSDDSHFFYCRPANYRSCAASGRGCAASKTANDACDSYLDNGFYRRYNGSVDGNSQSRPYLRSAHAGGARVSASGNLSSSSFTKYVMKSTGGIAGVYEYEKPIYSYKYTCRNSDCSSYTKGRVAGHGQNNQGRPFWNISLTPDLMQTFKIWKHIDQDHPFGSGGYGTGGCLRNHNSPRGNGGPAVLSIIWTRVYSALGGGSGSVLQIPFAQMQNKTLAFPGKGGKGEYQLFAARNGLPSYIKNYPSAAGGEGAPRISTNDKSTYNQSYAGGSVVGGDGRLASISTKSTSSTGGAGGLSSMSQNGYIDNVSLNGLTRELFLGNKDIAMYTSLLGAGSGGGGGGADVPRKLTGDGGEGSSGIVFIQW